MDGVSRVTDDLVAFPGVIPTLVLVRVGADPASGVYLRAKGKACKAVGIESRLVHFPEDVTGEALRAEVGPASCVYIGDDIPDEDAFVRLGEGDLSVKVGDGDTVAERRLADPEAVRSMLGALRTSWADIG